MENYKNSPEIPMGLGMALAQNLPAMNYFSALPQEQKQQIINHTHQIQSKQEMHAYVDSLFHTNNTIL
ncbi:MAG: hypothetical protein RR444_11360 [Oscillospiraceae bacterium]